MPKKAFALELLNVYLPGPKPPAATAAAARASEAQKTIEKTRARRRINMALSGRLKTPF
jgi:hypothetical protein